MALWDYRQRLCRLPFVRRKRKVVTSWPTWIASEVYIEFETEYWVRYVKFSYKQRRENRFVGVLDWLRESMNPGVDSLGLSILFVPIVFIA